MTLIFEVDGKPFQWKPGRFQSRVMTRIWWGYFAVSLLHVPLKELAEREFMWQVPR